MLHESLFSSVAWLQHSLFSTLLQYTVPAPKRCQINPWLSESWKQPICYILEMLFLTEEESWHNLKLYLILNLYQCAGLIYCNFPMCLLSGPGPADPRHTQPTSGTWTAGDRRRGIPTAHTDCPVSGCGPTGQSCQVCCWYRATSWTKWVPVFILAFSIYPAPIDIGKY